MINPEIKIVGCFVLLVVSHGKRINHRVPESLETLREGRDGPPSQKTGVGRMLFSVRDRGCLVRARIQIVRASPVPWSLLPGPENCSGMRRLEPLGVPRPGIQFTVPQSLLEFTGLGGAETPGISWLVWLRAFVDNGVDFLDARP